MKYPLNQFNTLIEVLKTLGTTFEIDNVTPCALHYMVYQQFSQGQTHNWLYKVNGAIKRGHQLSEADKKEAVKLVNTDGKTFELYPGHCNDSHIATAVKRALKELSN